MQIPSPLLCGRYKCMVPNHASLRCFFHHLAKMLLQSVSSLSCYWYYFTRQYTGSWKWFLKLGVSFRWHISLSSTIAKYCHLTEREGPVLNYIDLKIMKKMFSPRSNVVRSILHLKNTLKHKIGTLEISNWQKLKCWE